VITDGKDDGVQVIFIWQYERTVALCLLAVRVTALR